MKRQGSSSHRSILHFFKSVPRNPQEKAAAPTDSSSTNNASLSLVSPGRVLPDRARISGAASSVSDTVVTSVETLPPATSQTSANSSATKRVLSNGEQVVLNSDSDSDSDSLGDLDFGDIAPKSAKIPTSTTRRSTRQTAFEDEPELRRPPKAVRSNGKRSFNQLMETAQKNLHTEKKIQEHKMELAKAEEDSTHVAKRFDQDTLKQAIQAGDDSDQADRLYKAMQRTNQVRAHTTYHFFDATPSLSLNTPFPGETLPDEGWAACFKEPSARDHAFMTGFAHQIFRIYRLPEELATWLIAQICIGHSTALDHRYLEILQAHDEQLSTQLSPKRLDVMFEAIGAQVQNLENDTEISPTETQENERPLPASLKRIATLLTSAAPWLHSKARIHAFHLLCHTCLDDRILCDSDVLDSVQDAIEAIICQYADNHRLTSGVGSPPPDDMHSLITSQLTHVIPKLLSRISHPRLQANLINAFPTRSPLTAYLQRYLALSFLIYPDTVTVPFTDPQLPKLIHSHLNTSPHYRMSKDTNYSDVAARFALLDIAIGPGPTAVPYLPLTSPSSSATGSPTLVPTPTSSSVKQFNEEIDALAQHIKLLGNSIIETGAALDLTILDAKERCERLFWRLQHAVRIGGKKAENVFGDNDERQLKVKKFFKPLPKKVGTESIFD